MSTQQINDTTEHETRLIKASSLTDDIEPTKWLIDDIIPNEGMLEIFGASGSYKSFIALDMLYHISIGKEWHGHTVKQGIVVYIIGEGKNGVLKRIKALEELTQTRAENIYLLLYPSNLMDTDEMQKLENDIKTLTNDEQKVAITIFDTLHRNSPESDENSSKDFSKIMGHADKHLLKTSHVVGWIHHTGLGEQGRSRGTSARYGAMDTVISVSKSIERNAKMDCMKQKDSEPFRSMQVFLEPREITLKDGLKDSTLIVENIEVIQEKNDPKSLSEKEIIGLQCLRDMVQKEKKEENGAVWIKLSEWSKTTRTQLETPETNPNGLSQIFNRIKKHLLEVGYIEIKDKAMVSLTDNAHIFLLEQKMTYDKT